MILVDHLDLKIFSAVNVGEAGVFANTEVLANSVFRVKRLSRLCPHRCFHLA